MSSSEARVPTVSSCQSWGHERQSALIELCEYLKELPEIKAKRAIRFAAQHAQALGDTECLTQKYAEPGDDCAALKFGEGYQLLAMEGMQQKFVETDTRAAGWSSVMVNISDIAAMGGRPTAIVNALWHHDEQQSADLLFHIKRACKVFDIQFAGGHTSVSDNTSPSLGVGILGYAKKLLSCHHVKAGQRLFLLTDLNGSWHGNLPYWACVLGKTDEELRKQWSVPAELAERDLAVAAKDISNGGLLGTLIMMLELTGCGANIDINAVPTPPCNDLKRWFRAFQSFGFLLAVEPERVASLLSFFEKSPLTCAPIGSINDTAKITLDSTGYTETFWDIKQDPLTHFGAEHAGSSL